MWIRHWLEYEYGKEYFDTLIEKIISVELQEYPCIIIMIWIFKKLRRLFQFFINVWAPFNTLEVR